MRDSRSGKAAEVLESVVSIYTKSLEADDEKLLSSQKYLARPSRHIGYASYGKSAEIVGLVVRIYAERVEANDERLLSAQRLVAEGYNGMGKDNYGRAVELLEQMFGWMRKSYHPTI